MTSPPIGTMHPSSSRRLEPGSPRQAPPQLHHRPANFIPKRSMSSLMHDPRGISRVRTSRSSSPAPTTSRTTSRPWSGRCAGVVGVPVGVGVVTGGGLDLGGGFHGAGVGVAAAEAGH